MPYLVYLSTVLGHKAHQFDIIRRNTENLSSSFLTVGVVFHAGAWSVTPRTRTYDGRRFLDAALSVASQVFHLDRVVTVRACRGVKAMPRLLQYNNAEVIAWCRGDSSDNLVTYTPNSKDLEGQFPAYSLAQELESVDTGRTAWREVCFVQFLCVKLAHVTAVLSVAPGIPLLAGAGAKNPRVKAEGPEEEDAPIITRHGNVLDIALWPPPKQLDYEKAPYRQAHERSGEGEITCINKNNHIESVEGRNTKVHKFGNNGGIQSIPPQCHESTSRGDDDCHGDSEADDWQERQGAKEVKERIKQVALSPPNKNLPLTQPVPESPGGWSKEEDDDVVSDHSLWVNWKQELVLCHQINWRTRSPMLNLTRVVLSTSRRRIIFGVTLI